MQNGARWAETYYDEHFSLVADSTFPPSLPFLLSVYYGSRAFLFRQTSAHVGFFLPVVSHRESWARGDPDREIVGIRGVTRGDLVLVHNGSICLRSSCRTRFSSNAHVIIAGIIPNLFIFTSGRFHVQRKFPLRVAKYNKCALYANNNSLSVYPIYSG